MHYTAEQRASCKSRTTIDVSQVKYFGVNPMQFGKKSQGASCCLGPAFNKAYSINKKETSKFYRIVDDIKMAIMV